MAELSQPTQKLIKRYQDWYQSLRRKEETATIQVDEVASKAAAFYEKIRGVVDWREEHLMRRAAIKRILKRRLLLDQGGEELSSSFVCELIRRGYFPNNSIPEQKIEVMQKLIEKYVFIFDNSHPPPVENLKIKLYDWLLSIAACEVEEILDPPRRERALINCMFEFMKERIRLNGFSEGEMVDNVKNSQIYIATQRSLFKLDRPIISYHLLKNRYPDWLNLPQNQIEQIAKNIFLILEDIDKELKHPLAEKFYRICEKYDTPYLILGDIIATDPLGIQEKITKAETLESLIRESYLKRRNQLKSRVKRAAIYSTISIFATKMLLAFAIEIPFDKYLTGQFSYQSLGLNIFIPPLLMFFLVLTTRLPKSSNLERVILETMKIAYQSEKKDIYEIKSLKKKVGLLNLIIDIFYLTTFVISFGFLWWGLGKLDFGVLSKIIFLIFLSLISFAGVKVRGMAKELTIEEDKEGALMFLLDSFSLPFIRMGEWLYNQLAKYNIVIVLLTVLIEMPFHLFTEFLEQWRYFLKDKKRETNY